MTSTSMAKKYFRFFLRLSVLSVVTVIGYGLLTSQSHGVNMLALEAKDQAAGTAVCTGCKGMLYPRESESREVKELNGMWHFRADFNKKTGFTQEWYKQPLAKFDETIMMPVPSSFNDITQSAALREFVGWVWYDREFWVPKSWTDNKTRIMLRFESAHYKATVWVNGRDLTGHVGGHLPFEAEITTFVRAGYSNRVTLAIDNTLSAHTLPPSTTAPIPGSQNLMQVYQFDFFNYAGLHRPVRIYTTPSAAYIDDITVKHSIESSGTAKVDYSVNVAMRTTKGVSVSVQLFEKLGDTAVVTGLTRLSGCEDCAKTTEGSLRVDNPHLWWPWTMSDEAGYLYTLQVKVTTEDGVEDTYRLPVGIRTVSVSGNKFLINGKQFYFMGFGKHEDADIRGKGLDYPLIMKDVNLIKWIGANSFRTSHYPYAEELMDLCDQHGIVVIDEAPAVGQKKAENFADETLQHHVEVMHELIQRDKNRPSVVMWSVANEPASNLPKAKSYFQKVTDVTRSLDSTRPITFACNQSPKSDQAAQFMDVIGINQYYGWYHEFGHPEAAYSRLSSLLQSWHTSFHKPVMMTEYGATAIAGFHTDPPLMFTEDYQLEVLLSHFRVFNEYMNDFLVGEMVWAFSDFQTGQSSRRPNGNKKGIFTRQRQPKASARLLRQRYLSLAQGSEACYGHSLTELIKQC